MALSILHKQPGESKERTWTASNHDERFAATEQV